MSKNLIGTIIENCMVYPQHLGGNAAKFTRKYGKELRTTFRVVCSEVVWAILQEFDYDNELECKVYSQYYGMDRPQEIEIEIDHTVDGPFPTTAEHISNKFFELTGVRPTVNVKGWTTRYPSPAED